MHFTFAATLLMRSFFSTFYPFSERLQMAEDGDMEMRKMYGNPMVKVISGMRGSASDAGRDHAPLSGLGRPWGTDPFSSSQTSDMHEDMRADALDAVQTSIDTKPNFEARPHRL